MNEIIDLLNFNTLKQDSSVQDDPLYWNQSDIVYNDTANVEGYVAHGAAIDEINVWLKRHQIKKGAKVIELGCGGGRMLMNFDACNKKYGWNLELSAIDYSSKAIDVAKKHVPNCNFICGDMSESLSGSYDIFYSHTAIQHNSHRKSEKIIKRIHELIRSDGLFWMKSEDTIASWSHKKMIGFTSFDETKHPFAHNTGGTGGTAAWWVVFVARFGFELLEYIGVTSDKINGAADAQCGFMPSSYTWKKI